MKAKACPICEPGLWDADLEDVPEVALCKQHKGHPCADVFNQPPLRRRRNLPVSRLEVRFQRGTRSSDH